MPELSDSRTCGSNLSRQEIISFLGALCLFLSAMEYLIPKPMPFFRLGIANLPLILGLGFLSARDLFLVLFLKVLGQGLVNGTLASYVFLFSVSGSLVSLLLMMAVHRIGGKRVSLIGVSLAGAMGSSLVQIFLAITFIFGQSAILIAPLSLASGLITGLAVGLFAQKFSVNSQWLLAIKQGYLKVLK